MKKTEEKINNLIMYQGKDGAIEFSSDAKNETIWASQADIARVFGIERSVITKHINNLFKNNEIEEKSNVQKMHIANSDKPVSFYSLDIILAVGYRTNSKVAIDFRKWATKTLKGYIADGYAVNRNKIGENYEKFMTAVEDIKLLLPTEKFADTQSIIELVKDFASTWLSLDSYDKEELEIKKPTKKFVKLTTEDLYAGLIELKNNLIKKGEASDLFAIDRNKESLSGIVGNVMQSFGGEHVYKSVEEKAAHLLYFIIKNHPFIDGNKRSAAFAFIWYLNKNKRLDKSKINPVALTAITLLIAESDPKQKDKMVKLVQVLISRK